MSVSSQLLYLLSVYLGKDELANRLEQKTAQDQMNAAMAQLQQVFVDLGTALLPIVKVISFAAGIISTIIGFRGFKLSNSETPNTKIEDSTDDSR